MLLLHPKQCSLNDAGNLQGTIGRDGDTVLSWGVSFCNRYSPSEATYWVGAARKMLPGSVHLKVLLKV
jgi:hypothetical protein